MKSHSAADREADADGDHETPLQRERGARAVARAVRLRDDRIDPAHQAVGDHQRAPHAGGAEPGGGERAGADAAEHDRVDHAHQHGADLRPDDGDGQPHEGGDLATCRAHGKGGP